MEAPANKDKESVPYLDENDLIELPQDDQQQDPRKFYPYGPTGQLSFNQKQPKTNRYYSKLKTYYQKESDDDTTLIFESRFESGNLRRAVKIGENEYNLILKQDYNASCIYTQWYYFRVTNTRKNTIYKFNFVNLIKPESSYNQGMKPLVYSKKQTELSGIGWYRSGENIVYYQN